MFGGDGGRIHESSDSSTTAVGQRAEKAHYDSDLAAPKPGGNNKVSHGL
jgi:hypothetical protein